jgi:hypothetical protein
MRTNRPGRSGFASKPSTTFLRRYREEVIRKRKAEQDIEAQLAALEAQLRSEKGGSELLPSQIGQLEPEAQSMAAD